MLINAGTIDERQVPLFGGGQNYSTDKYVLAGDFSAVTVTSMTISDEAVYRCSIEDTNRVYYIEYTSLSVYGQ